MSEHRIIVDVNFDGTYEEYQVKKILDRMLQKIMDVDFRIFNVDLEESATTEEDGDGQAWERELDAGSARLRVEQLQKDFGGFWKGKHPVYLPQDWAYEVNSYETRLGYWEWVDANIAAEEETDYQNCEGCGDSVLTLSTRGWCDGCEAEADKPRYVRNGEPVTLEQLHGEYTAQQATLPEGERSTFTAWFDVELNVGGLRFATYGKG